jgi:hypothetical protein
VLARKDDKIAKMCPETIDSVLARKEDSEDAEDQFSKKNCDDSVCPKYIVDVMSPSISTLVEDENKKTARYYANINDPFLNIWADGFRAVGQVSKLRTGVMSY